MKDRHAGRVVRRGFTIMEVIVIVTILGVLAALVAPRFFGRIGQSKQAVARSNANAIANAVNAFRADGGKLEGGMSLRDLMERPSYFSESSWQGPYLNNADDMKDPWGNEYAIRVPGEYNVDFDIVSYGLDGKPGGEGEDADIVNGKK